jgi:hypothetical protein
MNSNSGNISLIRKIGQLSHFPSVLTLFPRGNKTAIKTTLGGGLRQVFADFRPVWNSHVGFFL